MRAARDAGARRHGRCSQIDLARTDYSAELPDFVTDTLPPRWVLRIDGGPGRAAGRLAQDVQQPLPQPEEGGQGRPRLPRGNVRPRTCRASTACTCTRCASTARCRAPCASSKLTRDLLEPGEFRAVRGRAPRARSAAGGVFHVFGGTVELIYNGSGRAPARPAPQPRASTGTSCGGRPSTACHTFDFGDAHSPTTSLGRFKSQWADPVPQLPLHVAAGRAAPRAPSRWPPPPTRSSTAATRDSLAAAWRRAPLQLTRIGAALAYRYL